MTRKLDLLNKDHQKDLTIHENDIIKESKNLLVKTKKAHTGKTRTPDITYQIKPMMMRFE